MRRSNQIRKAKCDLKPILMLNNNIFRVNLRIFSLGKLHAEYFVGLKTQLETKSGLHNITIKLTSSLIILMLILSFGCTILIS